MKYLLFTLFTISCATAKLFPTKNERVEITALTGSSIDFVQDKWGKADKEVLKGKKKRYEYKNIRFNNTDLINNSVEVEYCKVSLVIDQQNMIQSWEKSDCTK